MSSFGRFGGGPLIPPAGGSTPASPPQPAAAAAATSPAIQGRILRMDMVEVSLGSPGRDQ
jgi:hypothetical protein